MFIETLNIIANSWPIAIMVIGVTGGLVVNSRFKQAQDNSQAVRDLRASQAVTVRSTRDEE